MSRCRMLGGLVIGLVVLHAAGAEAQEIHRFLGDSQGDFLGYSVSGAGDVNNDGSVLFAVYGDSQSDQFGCAVSGAGDGVPEIIAGAYGDSTMGGYAGSALVYFVPEDCGFIVSVGSGCGGTGGIVPSLKVTGCTTGGGTLKIDITGGLGGAAVFLMTGSWGGALPLGGGCTLYAGPTWHLKVLGPGVLSGAGPGNGTLSVSGFVPYAMPAASLGCQAFVVDPGGALGFSNSNGISCGFAP